MVKTLPDEIMGKLKEFRGKVDVVVGIPSYNNVETISYVAQVASEGIAEYFGGKGLVLNSDGGSKDGTKETFMSTDTGGIPKLAFDYVGIPGKGSALRALMEAAALVESRALVFLDSDLRSVKPWWIERLSTPIMKGKAVYVTPLYKRHKYDGTITNHICYPLTSVLYGKKVRQPIGGDFGVGDTMVEMYLSKPDDVWKSDVARFGIDIWMTTVALCEDGRIVQAALGAKIHDVKDPGKHLGPMFSQVVGTLFSLMQIYERKWMDLEVTPGDVDVYGEAVKVDVEEINVDLGNLKCKAMEGVRENETMLLDLMENNIVRDVLRRGTLGSEEWVRIVYGLSTAFRRKGHEDTVIKALIPLYFARVAGFVEGTLNMGTEEAEKVIEDQLLLFHSMKSYLKERWAD